MNGFIYACLVKVAVCMGISFVVGLVMGCRVGYVSGLEYAERKMQQVVLSYAEEVRQLRMAQRVQRTNAILGRKVQTPHGR